MAKDVVSRLLRRFYYETPTLTLYADDILICASDMDMLDDLKEQFTQNFEMEDLGEMSQYLGMKITRKNGTIKADQRQYTKDILKRFDSLIQSHDKHSNANPIERDLKLTKLETKEMIIELAEYTYKFPYQKIVGALLFLSINTRLDIAYAVEFLSRFCKTPTYRACKALIRLLIFLRGTIEVGITFSGSTRKLQAFLMRTGLGILTKDVLQLDIYAAGGPISWNSKLRPTITTSTIEAQHMTAFRVIQECVWIKGDVGNGFNNCANYTLHGRQERDLLS